MNPCAPRGESFKPEADPWIPESKLPPLPNTGKPRIKSLIRKILLTTPEFPRFYADIILRDSPNSREANILRPHYQKICEKVNAMSNQNGTCTHIKVTGVRCGSPALTGEQFCYFHQNAHRAVRRPKQSRLHPVAMIEDEESIQYALMEVINALMKNTIDLKRATLILRALHIAVKNAGRVKFDIQGGRSVTQIPDYAEPTAEHEEIVREAELPAVAEVPYKPVVAEHPHLWEDQYDGRRVLRREAQAREAAAEEAQKARWREEAARIGAEERARAQKIEAGTTNGETAAIAPAATSQPGGISAPTPPVTNPNAVRPHNFKPPQPPTAQPATSRANLPARKLPQPASQAPKERKNAAHVSPDQSRRAARRG